MLNKLSIIIIVMSPGESKSFRKAQSSALNTLSSLSTERSSEKNNVDVSSETTGALRARTSHENNNKSRLLFREVCNDGSRYSTRRYVDSRIRNRQRHGNLRQFQSYSSATHPRQHIIYHEKEDDDHWTDTVDDDDEYRQIAERRKEILRVNPHLRQNPNIGPPTIAFGRRNRILQSDAPRKKYFKRPAHSRSTLHWGQRKLLFSEIEFLTNYGSPEYLVLYAGAAPGTHISFLSELFQDYRFVLVDPSPFNCKESPRIQIINDYFTDEIASRYKDQKTLFISDIRTADHKDMEFDENERFILADQLDQMRWVKILQPHKAMLKFRLPYTPGNSVYLDGDIYLPVWGPQSTTETRLVPYSPVSTRVYDHTQYEEQMFYFNTQTRSEYYEHSINFEEGEGLDHCYDCMSEIYILRQYLSKFDKDSSDQAIAAISKHISKQISETRTIKSTPLKINKYIVSLLFSLKFVTNKAGMNKYR